MNTLSPQQIQGWHAHVYFDGAGIVYQFIVGDNGVATALDEIHISGPSRFPKQP